MIFQQFLVVFLETYASILSPCQDGNVHILYTTTTELENKAFTINSQHIEQPVEIIVTLISEINFKKMHLAKHDCFFADLCIHFEPLIGQQYPYVCHHLRNEKEAIQDKQLQYKKGHWHTNDLHYGKEASKMTLFSKNTVFSVTFMFILNLCQDGYVYRQATIKELKKMSLEINSQNIKQKFDKHVTFILEIKPRKEHFLAKSDCFFRELCFHIEPL